MITVRVVRVRAEVDRAAARDTAKRYGFRLVSDVLRQSFNRAQILTPVDTGNLRSHNRLRVKQRTTRVVGELFNIANYSAAVHNGAQPHIIRPKKKKALKFTIGGETIIVRAVRHPGNKARPWLATAVKEVATKNGFVWTPLSGS